MLIMPPMNTETKEQVLQKGTVIKLNGFPYELLADVNVNGTAPENDPATGQRSLAVSDVVHKPR